MEGTLLDQRVFESLVNRCLPMIHEHFVSVDVQISVASLPYVHSALVADLQVVLEFVHQLDASYLRLSRRRLCAGNGCQGPLSNRIG